mgnify:CR=1 FL=1
MNFHFLFHSQSFVILLKLSLIRMQRRRGNWSLRIVLIWNVIQLGRRARQQVLVHSQKSVQVERVSEEMAEITTKICNSIINIK